MVAPLLVVLIDTTCVPTYDPAAGLNVGVARPATKVAVIAVSAVIVTEHVPVPAQPPPLHPLKIDPLAAVAVSVRAVPPATVVEQVAPQSIAAGLETTEPVPVPALLTVSANCCGAAFVVKPTSTQ